MIIGGKYEKLNIIPDYWRSISIDVNQYDHGITEMAFTVWNADSQIDLSDYSAAIYCAKPDGNEYAGSCEIDLENNAVIVPVRYQMTAVAGKVRAELVLVDSGQNTVHTANFMIKVEKAVIKGNSISDSEISLLNEMLQNATAIQAEVRQDMQILATLDDSISLAQQRTGELDSTIQTATEVKEAADITNDALQTTLTDANAAHETLLDDISNAGTAVDDAINGWGHRLEDLENSDLLSL